MQDPIMQKEQLAGAPRPPSRTARYQASLSLVLNIIQIVCGGLVILVSIIALPAVGADNDLAGLRFGSLFILAGLVGLGAAKYKSYGFIIPSMVMSILATICAVLLAMNLGFLTLVFAHSGRSSSAGRIAVLVVMVLFSIAEVIAAIWVSVLSGNIVCPCRGTDRGGEAKVYTNYRAKLSLVFGIIQIVIAVLTLVLGITQSVFMGNLAIATAFVSALVFYLPAGILGIVTSFRKTLPMILTHMILCILAAIVAGGHFYQAILTSMYGHEYERHSSNGSVVLGLGIVLILLALLELCIAISASTLCCRVTCCGPSQTPQRVYTAYKWTQARIIGALQIVLGILILVLWITVAVLGGVGLAGLGSPYVTPCVIMSIIAGSFGVNAAAHKTAPKIITHWILSLLTVLAALSQLALCIMVLIGRTTAAIMGFYAVFLLLALAVIAMAFWAAAISYQASVSNAYSRHAEKSGKGGAPLAQMKA